MRIALILATALCLAGCGAIDPAYTGKDAGTLVYSVGFETNNPYLDFQLQYSDVRADGSHSGVVGSIRAKRSAWDASPPAEFGPSDPERGQVVIQHLKAGNYEIFYYQMSWGCSGINFNICFESNDLHDDGDPKHYTFSLPFTIAPGKALYIGDYRVFSNSTNILAPNAVIYITDKSARDIVIARKRDPALGEVTVAVPDAREAHIKYIKNGPTAAK